MEDKVINLILELSKNGWTWFTFLAFVFFLFIWKPESFEKLATYLLKFVSYFSKKASKAYIKHDIQSRMNSFIKRMDKKINSFSPVKIDVNFFDPDTESNNIDSYLNDGKYFIRARKVNNPNDNFVNIAMAFISENLLKEAKHHISQKQKTTIDLYVWKKLLEEEKDEVMDKFVTDFLQPKSSDDKIRELLYKFAETDRAGLFFPVLLEELTFLWRKVFTEPKNKKIQEEVANLIDFLNQHANRKQWEDMSKDRFIANFSKFAFMIVWKKDKVDKNLLPSYKNYLKSLMDQNIDNIYLIWSEKIQDFINQVTPDDFLNDNWYCLFKKENYASILKKADWEQFKAKTYLLLIRRKNIDPIILNNW